MELLSQNHYDVIPLGLLYGNVKLGLIPAIGALPLSIMETGVTDLQPARTDAGAINYPDGHPSEESHFGPQFSIVKDHGTDQGVLRRFASLGWVVAWCEWNADWRLTGHVLLMDMGRGRDHHPWISLQRR